MSTTCASVPRVRPIPKATGKKTAVRTFTQAPGPTPERTIEPIIATMPPSIISSSEALPPSPSSRAASTSTPRAVTMLRAPPTAIRNRESPGSEATSRSQISRSHTGTAQPPLRCSEGSSSSSSSSRSTRHHRCTSMPATAMRAAPRAAKPSFSAIIPRPAKPMSGTSTSASPR